MSIPSRVIPALAILSVLTIAAPAAAQILHDTGQNVVPVYEGWERSADGSLTMVFGYFNRNVEEQPVVPIGANNMFEPGDPDRGQPTHFYPRRQQFMFRVPIPKDWGNKELIWTLTVNGRTEKAYGLLLPVWEIGPQAYEQNRSTTLLHHKDEPTNQPPTIKVVGAPQATVTVSEALSLTVSVGDDDLPAASFRPKSRRAAAPDTRPSASPMTQAVVRLDPGWRLGVVWVHHRGPGPVAFDPVRQPIGDGTVKSGQAVARARFSEPGTYVLRAYADDGVLMSYADLTVVVTPGAAGTPPRR